MGTTKWHIDILALFLIVILSSQVNAVMSEAAQDLMKKGWGEIDAGNTAEGVQLFRSAEVLVLDDTQNASEILFYIGLVYYFDQDYITAIDIFDEGLELNPEHPRLYFFKGKALKKVGKSIEAEENFNKAASLDSYLQRPWYERFPFYLLIENIPLLVLIIGFSIIGVFVVLKEFRP